MYTCRDCNKTGLPLAEMKLEKLIKNYTRGICKPCSNKYETTMIAIRAAEKNPENYLTCDDCDGIFKKGKSGRFPKLRTECPFCKSEDIARY